MGWLIYQAYREPLLFIPPLEKISLTPIVVKLIGLKYSIPTKVFGKLPQNLTPVYIPHQHTKPLSYNKYEFIYTFSN